MSERAGGWVYGHFRWSEADSTFEAWVQSLADDGWERSEYGPGAWSCIDGRRGYGITVRRWSSRPWAAPTRPLH